LAKTPSTLPTRPRASAKRTSTAAPKQRRDRHQEVRIGYDGIVFASDINGPAFAFTPEDWHNALAPRC
jgi:hypothetical protein